MMDFSQLIQMLMAQAGTPMTGGMQPQPSMGASMMPQMPMMNIPQFNMMPFQMPAAPQPIQTYAPPVKPVVTPPPAAAPVDDKSKKNTGTSGAQGHGNPGHGQGAASGGNGNGWGGH